MNVYSYTSEYTNLYIKNKQICFNNLPWKKIFLRVNRIFKQIYAETKKHNLENVYRLQMYMINSIEFKIFVLKYTVSQLYTMYYLDKNTHQGSRKAYEQKVTKKQFQYIEINLKRIIKQHLICICIKPTFDARLVKCWKQNLKFKIDQYDINRNSYYHYQNIRYIEKKLKVPSYIKESIIYCLERLDYIDLSKFYESRYTKNVNNCKYVNYVHVLNYNNFLTQILDNMNFTDHMWYKFNYIRKIQYDMPKLNSKNFSISRIVRSFKHHLKFRFLIKKVKFYRYLYLTESQDSLTRRLFFIYQSWYDKIANLIHLHTVSLCNSIVNQIIFFSCRKQNLNIKLYIRSISKTNLSINKTIYTSNIKKYYSYCSNNS